MCTRQSSVVLHYQPGHGTHGENAEPSARGSRDPGSSPSLPVAELYIDSVGKGGGGVNREMNGQTFIPHRHTMYWNLADLKFSTKLLCCTLGCCKGRTGV